MDGTGTHGTHAVISLNGEWKYMLDREDRGEILRLHDPATDDSGWPAMAIPGNWQLRGVEDYSGKVWFRRTFALPEACKDSHVFLRFSGVDYLAKVWLNGCLLGEHEGYFQPFEFPVDHAILRDGLNVLVVRVDAPAEEPGRRWPDRKRLIKGIFSHHDTRPGSWDPATGQSLGTGGIWNDVALVATGDVRVTSMRVTPILLEDGTARVRLSLEISNYSGSPTAGEVGVALVPDNFEGARLDRGPRRVWLQPGTNTLTLVEPIADPHLWWTWDHGRPDLYRAEIAVATELGGDTSQVRFGLRRFAVDADGNFSLNGRRIFIRGTNIIPTQWLSEYDRDMIARDIALLKGANINGVRVHAHVNRAEFYEACDEAGILVWQDFALQWSYEETPDFVDSAASQIADMVMHLYNHPSIVIWCCHNEPSVNQGTLDKVLLDVVSALDASRVVKSHSDFEEHPYYGWYTGHVAEYAQAPRGPVISEYGAQALPGRDAMEAMFRDGGLWPPDWRKWAYHDFQYDQTFNVAGIQMGACIDEFIQNSQSYQAALLKAATESYRLAKFRKIACLFQFMFVDCWPSITWSVVDYHRQPKQGYFALGRAFQPVLPCAVRDRERLVAGQLIFKELWVVNDLPEGFPGALLKVVLGDQHGRACLEETFVVDVPENQTALVFNAWPKSEAWTVGGALAPGRYTLKLALRSSDGRLLGENDYPVEVLATPEAFNMSF